MKHVRIAGLRGDVSAVSFGTADLGTRYTAQEGFRMLDAYLDRGGNFIDTARVYSDWVPGESGRSERILGEWLAQPGRRGRVVVATKGAHPRLESMHMARMAPSDIAGDIELSLKALRIDAIDLYYLHRDDRTRPVEEILQALEASVKAGKIRRYACSNWKADRMLEAQECARQRGYAGFVANQVHWNMASANGNPLGDDTCETFNKELRQAFHSTGILAVAWTSQARGFFTKLDKLGEDAVADEKQYFTEGNLRVYRKAREIADATGLSMTAVALNYLLCQPIPTAAVVGCRTMEQLEDVMSAADQALPPDALVQLEAHM